MATRNLTETLSSVDVDISTALEDIEMYCNRLQALGAAIQALLPADREVDPHTVGTSTEAMALAEQARIGLRTGIRSARVLGDMVDDAACTIRDSATSWLQSAKAHLGGLQ